MRQIRNKLLIALVLFGVASAAVASAQTSTWEKTFYPVSEFDDDTQKPGPTPNAGEPDIGQGGAVRNSATLYGGRTSSGTRTLTTTSPTAQPMPLAIRFWWAWSMWTARYLNRIP